MSLQGNSNDEKIWNFLKSKGLNDYGVAGLMGNIYAESGLVPTNLQNTYEKSLGYSDSEYTKAVDNGSYKNFVKDAAGYGLCQWTYWSRKQNLLDYAKSQSKSIGDLEMQLNFLYKELSEGYKSILNVLKNATSILQASNEVLLKFERPANQSESVQNTRAGYGKTYYDKFAKNNDKGGIDMSVTICHASISENGNAGWDGKSKAGDQTGREVCTRLWYDKSWDIVLRYKDVALAKKAAKIAKKLANSNLVGYDQSQRNTLYQALKKNNWNVDAYIKSGVKTETDCSAFMYAVWCCLIPAMRSDSNAPTTSTMRGTFSKYGFTVYKETKYTRSEQNLLTGDVLVKESAHTVMAITNGINASVGKTNTTPTKPSTPTSTKVTVEAADKYSKSIAGAYKTTDNLNMRTGAGTSKKIILTIPSGDTVQNYGYYTTVDGIKWYYIAYKDKTGFVSSKFLKKKK